MMNVAFLRAVNIGKRTARSAQLIAAAEALGYQGVWSYASSGNVVFEARTSPTELERRLEDAFAAALGFEATTFVRTAAELARTVAAEPFRVAGDDTHFITFLKCKPTTDQRSALERLSNDFDTLVVVGRDVHWLMHGRSIASTLKTKDWDSIIGRHRSTSRNVRMLRKLVEKLDPKPTRRLTPPPATAPATKGQPAP
jgi:uncharacterized protein (DUF1697 family)